MWSWRWKKNSAPGDADWRLRRAERFGGATVRCALGEISDLSATGMRVYCMGKPPVKPGGIVPIRLKFGDGSLQLQAQVRWCRRRGLKRHEIGLQFVQLKPGMPKVLEAIARFGMASAAKHMDEPCNEQYQHADSMNSGRASQTEVIMDLPNYYQVLGVGPEASDSEIRARYRHLAVALHPDRNQEPDAMQKFEAVNEAYHVLSDPARREAYVRMAG